MRDRYEQHYRDSVESAVTILIGIYNNDCALLEDKIKAIDIVVPHLQKVKQALMFFQNTAPIVKEAKA